MSQASFRSISSLVIMGFPTHYFVSFILQLKWSKIVSIPWPLNVTTDQCENTLLLSLKHFTHNEGNFRIQIQTRKQQTLQAVLVPTVQRTQITHSLCCFVCVCLLITPDFRPTFPCFTGPRAGMVNIGLKWIKLFVSNAAPYY